MAISRNAGNLSQAEVNACVNGGLTVFGGANTPALNDGDTLVLPVTAYPTGGSYTILIDGVPTAAINWSDDLATVTSKIQGATSTSVTVTGTNVTHYDCTFSNLAPHTVVAGTANLTPNDYRNSVHVLRKKTGILPDPTHVPPIPGTNEIATIELGNYWSTSVVVSKNIVIRGGSMLDGPNMTLIKGDANPCLFDAVTNSSDEKFVMRDMVLQHCGPGASRALLLEGTARPHILEGQSIWKGGFQISNIRFKHSGDDALPAHPILYRDWPVGVIDHPWFDLADTPVGSGVIDCNHTSTPGRRQSTTVIPLTQPNPGVRPSYGVTSYATPYIWGGGPGRNGLQVTQAMVDNDTTVPKIHPVAGWWADYDAIYVEDAIIEHQGIGITNTDSGLPGPVSGGGRIVLRYSALWSQTGGHAFGGTGNCASGYIMECYHNYYRTPASSQFRQHNLRGGAHVFFNEVYEGPFNNPAGIAGMQLDRLQINNALLVGAADGTNFLDKNHRDTLDVVDGASGRFDPLSRTGHARATETRIGDVYAQGTGCALTADSTPNAPKYKLTGFDVNAPAGKYVGFTIRNQTQCDVNGGADSEGTGCQYLVTGTGTTSMVIGQSDAGDGTGINIYPAGSTGAGGDFTIAATDTWEMRWIDKAIGMSGGTLIPQMNGGSVSNFATHGFPVFMVNNALGQNRYWCDQRQDGDWEWNNYYRLSLTTGNYTLCQFDSGSAAERFLLGGRHNATRDPLNAGTGSNAAHVDELYPRQNSNPLRIGPEWDTGSFLASPNPVHATITVTQAYGAPYPHPLVSATAGPVISLSGTLDFGNVTIGSASPTSNLHVANTGTALLTVTGVTYPLGFSGLTAGFTVPAGSFFDIAVAFTPLNPVLYSGSIVVSSDTIIGSGAIACSGTGVGGQQATGGHRRQARDSWGF